MPWYLPALCLLLVFYGCSPQSDRQGSLINTSHLDHLYSEFVQGNDTLGFVHIYAEYPDYRIVDAPGEGIACMDDVARAAVFYLRHFRYTGTEASLKKAEKLLAFVLALQNENGFFHNFIDADGRIQTDTFNSKAVGDWWSWRALWALAEAFPILNKIDLVLADRIRGAVSKILPNLETYDSNYNKTKSFAGISVPVWLPLQYAADQAAVIILGLAPLSITGEYNHVKSYITILADGLLKMQAGDAGSFPFGAFLSWRNLWHAYGNSQAHALILAHKITGNELYLKAALREIDNFYPWQKRQGYLHSFTVRRAGGKIELVESRQFEQIAYGIRPMVFACLEAFRITGRRRYAEQAAEYALWLMGDNMARQRVYDPQSGRCFDGINGPQEVNLNSGAESTIEALLTLLEIEHNKVARDYFFNKSAEMKIGSGAGWTNNTK